MMQDPTRICDCRSRVLWLGEDEAANVVAVGSEVCVIGAGGHRVTSHRKTGKSLKVFLRGCLLTVHSRGGQSFLHLPEDRAVALPFQDCECYDSVYVPAVEA